MPIPIILGIAFLFASLFGYVGYRLSGGTRHDDKLGRSRRGGCLPGNATAAHFLKKSA